MNTSQLWDGLWSQAPLPQIEFSVALEEKGVIWSDIERALRETSMPPNPRVVELGAGSGINSAVFARRGANVTVLDYSKTALDVSAELFSKLGLAQTQVLADAMHLPSDLVGQFDISSSFGVCEHFEGEDRYRIISSHFDVLRPGGLAIISVPNARCLPYRIWKAKREILGTWQFGLEIPFSRQELSAISRRAGMRTHGFVGSSFIDSFDYLLPFARWKRSLLKRFAPTRLHDPSRLKKRNPSAMDAYFGAAVVLIAQKPLPRPG